MTRGRAVQQTRRYRHSAVAHLVAAGACAVAVTALIVAIMHGAIAPVDERLLLAFRDAHDFSRLLGPSWIVESVRDVSALGSNAVLAPLCVGIAIYLATTRHPTDGILLLVTYAGAVILGHGIKIVIARARPEVVPALAQVYTFSLPSAHAVASAAVYGFIATRLLTGAANQTFASTWFGLSAAALVCVAIGLSRVALGVHFPSDVLAGWLIGCVWLCLILAAAKAASRTETR